MPNNAINSSNCTARPEVRTYLPDRLSHKDMDHAQQVIPVDSAKAALLLRR